MHIQSKVIAAAATLAAFGSWLLLGGAGAREPVPTKPRWQTTAKGSLCRAGETVLFQCGLKRASVGVCSGATAGRGKYVEYRHASAGRPDLTYPGPKDNAKAGFHLANVMYSGGGEAQIIFGRAGYRYTVYSRMVRTGFVTTNDPKFEAGVGVIRGNRLVSDQQCVQPHDADLDVSAAEKVMPRGPATEWAWLDE